MQQEIGNLPMAYRLTRTQFEIFKNDNFALRELVRDVDNNLVLTQSSSERELWKTFRAKVVMQMTINDIHTEDRI